MPALSRAERATRRVRRRRLFVSGAIVVLVGVGLALLLTNDMDRGDRATADAPDPTTAAVAAPPSTAGASAKEEAPTTTGPTVPDVVVDPASFGTPWGSTVNGLLTFRGNPTRSYHGQGPVPAQPKVRWKFPDRAMCGQSAEGGETRTWCGTGWTGQPAVFERDGRTWVVFGAYDYKVHFVDADTGGRILPDFPTGDIIKGSPTIDPDGFPLVYIGSRDNNLRAIAIDRPEPTELWRLNANDVSPTLWNNDWDGSPLVVNDHLLEGGENSQFHIAKLNRAYGPDGLVTVAPSLVFNAPGWDDELLRDIGDRTVSIEESVTVAGDTAWFANSGGLLQGWDVSFLRTGTGSPTRTFRYWLGDDVDASIVADADGFLYVGVEHERGNARSDEVGQLLKIDPRVPDAPIVWSVKSEGSDQSGTWSTAAVMGDTVIWPTRPGTIYGIDRASGALRWTLELPSPLMGSPVVVDGVWIQGDCNGVLHGFDVHDPHVQPRELWAVELGGCIESTPAVWKGRIYVGTRAGLEYALDQHFGMLVAAALIVMGILEIYVIVQVGQAIGVLYTIALLFLMGILGVWLGKREGFSLFRRFRQTVAEGRVPTTELVDGVLILTGATLMIVPGFISDVIGICLLIPATRAIPRKWLKGKFYIDVIDDYGPRGRGPRPVPPDDVIDL